MAYKFNGGQGAVICDHCRKMIDSGISYREYEFTWGMHGDDGDFCMLCKMDVAGSKNAEGVKTRMMEMAR